MYITDEEVISVCKKLDPFKNKVGELYTSLTKPNPNFSIKLLKDKTGLELKNSGKDKASFDNQIELKLGLRYKVNSNRALEIFKWIICKWGGIPETRFKSSTFSFYVDAYNNSQNKDDTNKAAAFLDYIYDSEAKNNVASWSKVASFLYPDECYIYDTRVSFTLDILLEKKVFPVPSIGNETIKAFNTKTNKGPTRGEYKEYCRLIECIHKKLFTNKYEDQNFVTEMLLFALIGNKEFVDKHVKQNTIFPRRPKK